MFRKFAAFIFRFKWPITFGLLLFTGFMVAAIPKLQIDPSMEPLFVKSSPEYLYYKQYSEKYGSDQMIALAMSTSDLFTLPNLKLLQKVTFDLEKFEQVEKVVSLANVMDIRSKFVGVKIVPALHEVFDGNRSLEELRQDILQNELYQNNLISSDGKIANILVYLKPLGNESGLNGAFIENLRKYLKRQTHPGIQFYAAGAPVEQYDFIKLIRRDQMTFVPLIAALLVLTTFLIYGSFACMILSMSIVSMTLIWTMGTISLLGQPLNLMTSLLAPVIMIVAVVNSIYLINVFFEVRPHHPSLKNSIVITMQLLGIPCFLTHFVTILGFISLALNEIPAIRSFGIFAALGTLYSYLVEVILTPVLFQILPYRYVGHPNKKASMLNRMLVEFIEKLDFKWKWLIAALTALVIVLSIQGMRQIEVDTNIVKQMKPDLPLAVATRFIDQKITGVYSLGFVIRRKDGSRFDSPEIFRKLDELKIYLESLPGISKVNSITTVVKKIHEARKDDSRYYIIPENRSDLRRYLKGILKSRDAEQYISRDLREVRLEARMQALGTREGAEVERLAREYLKEKFENDFEYQLTGNVVLLGRIAKGLVQEQMQSFSFALGSILLVMIIIFRSFRLGLLAAIPNLIPILMIYGLMGFCKIELSTPTAMISSIVLGMIVDASIQFLYRFRLEFEHRHHYLQALHHTCRNMGQSMFVSTMILVVGFSSSIFASFRPTIHFGVLTALTILFAFICTLIVLPVCLLIVKPFGPQRLFKRRGKASADPQDSIHLLSH